jgi:hypothetical protein
MRRALRQILRAVAFNWAQARTYFEIQGGSNMTGTNCDLFTHKSSRSYFNHLVRHRYFLLICMSIIIIQLIHKTVFTLNRERSYEKLFIVFEGSYAS